MNLMSIPPAQTQNFLIEDFLMTVLLPPLEMSLHQLCQTHSAHMAQ